MYQARVQWESEYPGMIRPISLDHGDKYCVGGYVDYAMVVRLRCVCNGCGCVCACVLACLRVGVCFTDGMARLRGCLVDLIRVRCTEAAYNGNECHGVR
ncbi:hypothetical protein HBH69_037000 [Parastagonospora nodorum]|nr:hypothetical protein HBH43_072380 [Parastagonospora nodorum]KAH4921069.1 hypothetical protein HBI79_189060 [Parastagonospora nodorum]KAH5029073.1 hypothetical protein HBI74_103960 [Parastagonospora nodorum]KAH5160998.1 hypothetical protein HBH69_037000 [Parastagonospora nodorum]KAH5314346.1 hypothetical protein HBI11_082540 [Parastagonospora nodorum]